MLSGLELMLALLVGFVGSMVMGLVSFGFGMVLSPLLLLILEPRTVVVAINSLTIPILGVVLFRTKHLLPFKQVLPMAVAGVAGVPIGVLILNSASPGGLRVGIAVLILALVLPMALRVERPFSRTWFTTPFFGFLGALLVTGMGVGTPLVVLHLVNQKWAGSTIRSSIAFFSLVVAVAAVAMYGAMGFYTEERIGLVLKMAPIVLLGVGIASWLVRYIDDGKLRQVVLIVIVIASITLLVREAARV